jgi:hypothetical protein
MEMQSAGAPEEHLALLTEQNTRLQRLVAELLRKNEELRRGLARAGTRLAAGLEDAN